MDSNQDLKSKTQIKKDFLIITNFTDNLISLRKDDLEKLNLPSNILYEILKAKLMQKIHLKRQKQYIGKLIRNFGDFELIEENYNALQGTSNQEQAYLKRLELIRDSLLNEETRKKQLFELYEVYNLENQDIQKIKMLIKNVEKEKKLNKPPKSFREIYQILKSIILK